MDDGSVDDSTGIVERLAEIDARFSLIKTNGVGRAPALNLALKACSGKYVMNMDADDLAHPRRVEYLCAAMEANTKYDLMTPQNIRFWGDEVPKWPSFDSETLQISPANKLLLYGNPICHSGIIARRKSLFSVEGYNEDLQSQVDFDLWVRLAKNGARLGIVNMPLVAKRMSYTQSFAGHQPIRYALKGIRTRMWALRTLNAGPLAWINLALRFFWAFVPLHWRYHLRKLLVRRA